MELTHTDAAGNARMVDVSEKAETDRRAVAECFVRMAKSTLEIATSGKNSKGDVFTTAKIAGIQAAKRTSEIIPMCHNIGLTSVELAFEKAEDGIRITSVCKARAKTGVEMEALTACSAAALTVYDMVKAADKRMVIDGLKLLEKSGGKSGRFVR